MITRHASLKDVQTFFLGLLAAVAFILTGNAEDLSILPVDFPNIEINGRPANMFLDTAVPGTFVLDPWAKHLGLKDHGTWAEFHGGSINISELTPVKSAGQTFMAPLLIGRLPWWARLASHLFGKIPIDGFVGWPEVRDNILVFDSGQRTIRRVEKLPPETTGWLKLKVVPDDYLLLELPLDDGETGAISVDTSERGSTAVTMSAGPWKEWKATHPHGSRASEIKLGALTLTDVTVKEMSAGQVKDMLNETPAARAVWKFGMAALPRVDLVVDGKEGWAYLRPKSPSQTPRDPDADADWKVAANVRLGRDNLFVYSGVYYWFKNDFTSAVAEYNRALALNPRNADAYSCRGMAREILGDFTDALSDYDKFIALRPENSEWERDYRKALLWRLGRPPEEEAKTVASGKKAFESVVMLDPVVVYAVRPKGVPGKERWAKIIGLFLDGSLDENTLLTAARKSDGETPASEQKGLAYYYIGMMRLSRGDKAAAQEWFNKCQSAGIKDDDEYYFAVAELARLGAAAPR